MLTTSATSSWINPAWLVLKTRRAALLAHGLVPVLAISLLIGLSGCGGGGTGGNAITFPDDPPAPSPPPVIDYDTPEYRQNYGLDAINSIAAYEAGLSGRGITVAVIDTGIDTDHPDLAANIHSASTNVVTGIGADVEDADISGGHGTAVSGVIAARRNDNGMHGVAFNSRLLAVSAVDPDNCAEDDCSFSQQALANGIDHARVSGAHVVNLSLGGGAAGPTLTTAMRNAVNAGLIIVISAGNDGDEEDANGPSAFASVATASWANNQIIIVGATDETDTLADFSNRAGEDHKDLFVVAPGVAIQTTWRDGGYVLMSGTSVSAPHASGAVALLLENFPNLSARDVTEILLSTARDLGDPGVDTTYGRGLIDLEAALQPVGVVTVATDQSALSRQGRAGSSLEQSSLMLSPAFGDALDHAPGLTHVMGLDRYDRSYRIAMGDRIRTGAFTPDLGMVAENRQLRHHRTTVRQGALSLETGVRWDAAQQNWAGAYLGHSGLDRDIRALMTARIGYAIGDRLMLHSTYRDGADRTTDRGLFLDMGGRDPISAVARNGTTVGATWQATAGVKLSVSGGTGSFAPQSGPRLNTATPDTKRTRATILKAAISLHPAPGLSLTSRAGVMTEDGSVLGTLSSGALALGDKAQTTFGDVTLEWTTGGFLAYAGGGIGQTRVRTAAHSLIRNISSIGTSSFAAGIEASDILTHGDRFGIEIAQPLRIESGRAMIRTVTGRDYTRNRLTYDDIATPLSPGGRELDIGLGYAFTPMSGPWPGGRMRIQALHQINAGHRKGLSETALLVGFTRPF